MVFGSFRNLALACAIGAVVPLVGCGESKNSDGDAGESGNDSGGSSGTYVSQLRTRSVDKVDLLLMIDNSISMGDKQQLMAKAVPLLLQRLILPACLNEAGSTAPRNSSGSAPR